MVWKAWWFLFGGVAVLLLVSFLLYRRGRVRKAQEIERLRSRIAGDLHDEIGSSLGGIALMADHLSEKFMPDESGFRRLQEMSTSARQMSDAIRDIIWFVDTEHNSLEDLTDRLRSIVRSMLPRTIESSFSVQSGHPANSALTMEQKRNLVLMFKEILHNTVRHARPKKVDIILRGLDDRLEIQVTDNGCGFNQEQGTRGNGLVNLHRRADDLGGRCSIRSVEGQGTTVMISVPLGPGSSHQGFPKMTRMRDRQ